MKKSSLSSKIIVNLAIIALVIVVGAIAAHFLLRVGTRHGARCTVPQFKGISLREAEVLARDNNLHIFINDSLYVPIYAGGTVLDQLPAAGVEVKPGRTIYVVINAFGDRMVEIPYVAGRSLRQAKNMLDVAGLEISKLVYTEDMATNYVLRQSYLGREIDSETTLEAVVGSGVELTVGVSNKDPYTRVPNVIGLSLREAKSRLWDSGLNVGRIKIDKGVNLLKDKNAKIYVQSVGANTDASWGRSISLSVTLDSLTIVSAVAEAARAEAEYEKALLEAEQEQAEAVDSLAKLKQESQGAQSLGSQEVSDEDNFFE